MDQLLEDLNDIPAAFPPGVYEYRKFVRVKPKHLSRRLSRLFSGISELRMNRHARYFDTVRRDSIIDQLLTGFLASHEVKPHIIAGPTFPKAVARVSNDGNQGNAFR